ncbi:MAG: hypothetical protein WKF59_21875 [Chitinophagaceae bacterium]
MSKDGKSAVYSVSTPNATENKSTRETFVISVAGGAAVQTFNVDSVVRDKNISPNGKYIIYNKEVKLLNVTGKDLYPELTKSNAYVFDNLNYRHWDKWNDGTFDHVFIAQLVNGKKKMRRTLCPANLLMLRKNLLVAMKIITGALTVNM